MFQRFFISIILICCISQIYAQHSAMIGERTAVFYPAGFQAGETLPSFALINEPVEIGEVAGTWSIYPEFSFTDGKNIALIDIPEGTDLYGNGEVIGDLRNNGKEVILWNTDNYGYFKDNGKRLYQSHPWVLGVRPDGSSFGILADHTWKQSFFLDDPVRIESEGPPFRIIVIEGDSPQEVVMELAELTGKIELPPLWALGYHQCRYSYYPASQVEEVAQTFRDKQIPCDVIWMDIDYMDGFRVFTFDPSGFPDPSAVNDFLHDRDFHSIWMIDPGVKRENGYAVYDAGTIGNHWVKRDNGNNYYGEVWPGSCAFPDFTMPQVQEWWAALYPEFMATGIDGVWNDMNEPAVFNVESGTMPEDNIHRGGGDLPEDIHLRYHNVYGYLMVKATREGILQSNPEKRPFVLTRANHLGGHRYAATWTGDNISSTDHMKMSIPMSLNLGLSGQPFSGPDIGGFIGDPGAELLAQWMAIGAFYPFSRNHTSTDTGPQEPWAYGAETEMVSRRALQRRYRLLPYLYTLFRESSVNGMPVMRPAYFADPSDNSLREEQEAFLLGEDLMIIPEWSFCPSLPQGKWRPVNLLENIDEDDGYQAKLKQRPGSVLPLGEVVQSTEHYSSDSITLLIAPDDALTAYGELYADAGEGYQYADGEFLHTSYNVTPSGEDSLEVQCRRLDGGMSVPGRIYRPALVTNYGVFYFEWTTDTTFQIPLLQDIFIHLTSPADGSEFDAGDDISLEISIEGNLAIENVRYAISDVGNLETDTAPWSYDWEDVETGVYFIQAVATIQNDFQIISKKVMIKVGEFGEGAITYEAWRDIGDSPFLPGLTSHPDYPDNPDERQLLDRFASPVNTDDEFGARIIGYVHAPRTSDYKFWVSGDDESDLWLSTTDQESDLQLIAEVPGWSNTGEWEKYPQQESDGIPLVAGEKYLIMARHKENDGQDHLEAAWSYRNQDREIIPGEFLSPYDLATPVLNATYNELDLYPNPADHMTILSNNHLEGVIGIYTADGKLINEFHADASQTEVRLNTEDLANGAYWLYFNSGGQVMSARLIVIHD